MHLLGLRTSWLSLTQVPGRWGSFTLSLSRTCESSGAGLVRASCCCGFRTPGAGAVGRGPGERGECGEVHSGSSRWSRWGRGAGPEGQPRAALTACAPGVRGRAVVRTGFGCSPARGPPCSVLSPRWPVEAGLALGPATQAPGAVGACPESGAPTDWWMPCRAAGDRPTECLHPVVSVKTWTRAAPLRRPRVAERDQHPPPPPRPAAPVIHSAGRRPRLKGGSFQR